MGVLSNFTATWTDLGHMMPVFKHGRKFSPKGHWSSARLLDERVEQHGDSLAVAFEERRYSWREVDAEVNRYARFFASRQIGKGDVVAIMMDNRPEFLFAITALNRLRAVAALINSQLVDAPLVHALHIVEPKAVLAGVERVQALATARGQLETSELWCQGGQHDAVASIDAPLKEQGTHRPANLSEPETSEPMCYIYTSGTTGLPKAAVITNRRFIVASYSFGASVVKATPKDVIYVALPLYHSSGMFVGWGSGLTTGAAVALRRKFSATKFWADVHQYGATVFLYIGELCRYLLNQPPDPKERGHALRLAVGNGLRPDIWQKFSERFSIPLVREFYAATEGNAPLVNFTGKAGMIGRIRPGQVLARCDESDGSLARDDAGQCVRVAVGEKGMLLAKITARMSFEGYVDKKATESKIVRNVFDPGDAYFNSGDILQLHEDSWVSFADRAGDTFRWKGENVSTTEVAEVINGLDGVLESNVYGVEVAGADGKAGMCSVRGGEGFDVQALAAFVADRLPAYQRPYFLRVQSDMQITGTFKHRKVDYQKQGYDPSKVSDALYFLDGNRYVPIDDALHGQLAIGKLQPGQAVPMAAHRG